MEFRVVNGVSLNLILIDKTSRDFIRLVSWVVWTYYAVIIAVVLELDRVNEDINTINLNLVVLLLSTSCWIRVAYSFMKGHRSHYFRGPYQKHKSGSERVFSIFEEQEFLGLLFSKEISQIEVGDRKMSIFRRVKYLVRCVPHLPIKPHNECVYVQFPSVEVSVEVKGEVLENLFVVFYEYVPAVSRGTDLLFLPQSSIVITIWPDLLRAHVEVVSFSAKRTAKKQNRLDADDDQ